MEFLAESLIELITQTSSNLPPDVRAAMSSALRTETPNTQASQALNIIAANIDMAADDEGPICQDTGMPTFFVHTPVGVNQIAVKKAIREAVAEATKRGKLRPNSVDSLTGKNSGNNLGIETPVIHFEQWEHDEIEVKLILKGGGCENKNIQYSLPCRSRTHGQSRPRSRRRPQVPASCGLAGAGPGMRARSARRMHRQRPRARLRSREGAVAPHAGRHESESGTREARKRDRRRSQSPGHRRDGLRRKALADRLQDRRRQSPARQLLCFGGLRMLGVPPPGRASRREERRDHASGSIAIRRVKWSA